MRFEPLPQFVPGMSAWGWKSGAFQFVITHEDGQTLRPEDRSEWVGYTASYKDTSKAKPFTNRIGGVFASFTEAENACVSEWRRLRQPQ